MRPGEVLTVVVGAFTLTTAGPASAFFQSVSVLTTQASPGSTVGNPIFDTATLGGAPGNPGPTGTITFDLYGPDDPTCARGSIFTSIVPVTPAVASDGDSVFLSLPRRCWLSLSSSKLQSV